MFVRLMMQQYETNITTYAKTTSMQQQQHRQGGIYGSTCILPTYEFEKYYGHNEMNFFMEVMVRGGVFSKR